MQPQISTTNFKYNTSTGVAATQDMVTEETGTVVDMVTERKDVADADVKQPVDVEEELRK